MIKKKLIAILSVATLTASIFTGCASSSDDNATEASNAPTSTASNTTTDKESESNIKLETLNVSHQPYSHGLPTYIADQEGAFGEKGLEVNILWFTSGPAQNEALGADEWDCGAMGSPPAITGGVAYNSHVIAVSVDDTVSVDYWVRPDSEIASITGEVEGYPDILGNAEAWKGKTVLCPTATSAHFMLIATLSKLGLTQDDVNIIHMDVSQAYTAFKAGQGDIVALWDPQSYNAENEDWIKVSSGEATGESMPTVIVASEKAINEKPEEIKAWLKTYFETCDTYRADIDGQSEYLLTMQLDNGIDTTEELAKRFCNDRELPSLEKNIELFSGEYGSRSIDVTMSKIIDFFVAQGSIEEADKQTLIDNGFIDSTFIDMLASEQ